MTRLRLGLGLLMLGALSVSVSTALAAEKIVQIDGSSTVFPVTEAVAEEFQNSKKGEVKVTVGISGTGGGFKKFCRGEIDISDASRPISKEEMANCKTAGIEYLELPIAFDALTVAVNPNNKWSETMTIAELKKIWEPDAQGKITKWNQIRAEWPDSEITLFGAGTDSGTFDYFTEAVVGKAKASRGDFTGSEDDNTLVKGIEGDKFALGYIPYAYFEPNKSKLKAVKIDWEKDTEGPVEPSTQTVLEGKYNPLSRPLFIYVSKKAITEKPWVKEFTEFYVQNVKTLAAEVKYLPLTEESYKAVTQRVASLSTGTAFAGEPPIGIRVEEILKKKLIS